MQSLRVSKSISPKILWTAVALLSAVFVAAPVLAVGPSFNIFPVGYLGGQNNDYPLLDGRNATQSGGFSTSQADHDDGVAAAPGETVEFVIYYHNGTADDANNTAHNVRVAATLPTADGLNHTVAASISADNAATVSSSDTNRGGNLTVKISGSSAQHLEYLAGSTQWFRERSTTGQAMPDGITSGGVNLGDVRGCWQFAGFVKFRARVTATAAAQGLLAITKTVAPNNSSAYSRSISASPSEIVNFRLQVQALNASVSGVSVRDILPAGLVFLANTTRVNGLAVADSTGLTGGGYDFGTTMSQGQTVEVTFQAQLASASYFGTSSQTLTNTANARGTNVATVQDTASIFVTGTVASTSFSLSKSAYNQTQGIAAQSAQANPGDVITYTLTYRNTGSQSASGVVVQDDLSDVLQLADMVNQGEGYMSGSLIVFPAISVPAGVSIDKTFQVRVKDNLPSNSDLVMTNTYGTTVNIYVRPPTVKGAYYPPKTGPEENLALAFALSSTAVWYFWRRKHRVGSRELSA